MQAGGGEALLGVIAAATAIYGGSLRNGLFDELAVLESSGVKNEGAVTHVPTVRISPSGANGRVQVEVTVSTASPDFIDYIWVKDADSGDIIAGRGFSVKEPLVLTMLATRGRRLVPIAHSRTDGVWEGTTFSAQVE